jgi:ribosomal protein S20
MQLFWQSLANKLGLSVATVQQDVIDAAKDAINQAVKQGLMSQAQANNLLNRLQNIKPGQNFGLPGFTNRRFYANPPARRNVPPYGNPRGLPNSRYFGPGQGFMFDHAGGLMNLDVLEAVAKALNMNAADVTNALASGKTLADLAKSQNVNASAVQSAIVNAISANLDRAVKDGLMTQAQANALKSRLNPNNINLNQRGLGLGGPAFGPGMMMPYNRGMIPNGRGMMPNNPGTNRNGRGQFRWY